MKTASGSVSSEGAICAIVLFNSSFQALGNYYGSSVMVTVTTTPYELTSDWGGFTTINCSDWWITGDLHYWSGPKWLYAQTAGKHPCPSG